MARTTASAPKNPESVASSRSASRDCWIWSCSPSKLKLIPELTSCKVRRIACSSAFIGSLDRTSTCMLFSGVLVLREREIGNGFGGAPDAVVFRILYQADDLVQLLGARRSGLTPEARSNRICAQPELFGECLVHDGHTWGLAGVVVIEIAPGDDRNAQRIEVIRADATEVRILPLG